MTTCPTDRRLVATNVPWAPQPNAVHVHAASASDPSELPGPVTSVFAFVVRDDGALLLVDVRARGWDVPGGHVEPAEDLRNALRRELLEEAGLLLEDTSSVGVAGWLHLRVDGPVPADYPYPHPDSVMLAFTVRVPSTTALAGTSVHEEIASHMWVPRNLVGTHAPDRLWLPLLDGLER